MGMSIEFAIKHCEEVADKLDARKKVYENLEDDRKLFVKEESDCRECAKEHRQLAEWLRELKELKSKCKWIKYDYRTICPKNHNIDNPYWRIPENTECLKYCPYCGKEIEVKL